MATGHQRSDGRANQKPYLDARKKKLSEQRPEPEATSPGANNVLRGVRIYIGGYLDNSTDIEMKRIVKAAGGEVLSVLLPFFAFLVSPGVPQVYRLWRHAHSYVPAAERLKDPEDFIWQVEVYSSRRPTGMDHGQHRRR